MSYLDVNRLMNTHDKEPAQVHYEIDLTVTTAFLGHLHLNFLALLWQNRVVAQNRVAQPNKGPQVKCSDLVEEIEEVNLH